VRRILALAVLAGVLAPVALAGAPDPQAGSQEPLRIMRVGEALALAARPLADVRVLVADTGLDLQHPDLAPRLFSLPAPVTAPNPDGNPNPPTVPAGSPGWDLIGTNAPGALAPDGDPDDPAGGSGHGTATAGMLGAAHDNGIGGTGVAPNARFVALRTCWDDDQCYQYLQDDAIDWAADRGVRVASFSWLSGPIEADLRAAIVNHPSVLFVTIPSGNGGSYDADGDDPQPCNVDSSNVLCVSTSAPDDGLACGAYGPATVDVAVPTGNNVTTLNGGGFSGATGCATSWAAPTAAGVATILFGIDPTASAADVKAAIVDSARRVPAWAGKSVSGGIVDAAAAVALFQQRRGIAAPTPTPTATATATPTATATGAPASTPTGAQPDATPPLLTLRITPGSFRRRATLVATLTEPAQLRLTLQRIRNGRRTTVGALRAALPAGTSRTPFRPRRSNGRALPPGRYRVTGRATDAAGNRSAQRAAAFRITR
jgi:hypothetical protein